MDEMSAQELQENDKTLEDVRTAADRSPAATDCGFFRKSCIDAGLPDGESR